MLKYECRDPTLISQTLKTLTNHAEELSRSGKAKGLLIEGQDLTPIIGNKDNEL